MQHVLSEYWNKYEQETHMPVLIHLVVGEFNFLEWNHLFPELLPREGWVGVHVKAAGRGRIRLTGHEPRWAVVRVPVPFVVHRNNIH